MGLGSGVAAAVVQAGGCSSNSTPSLGTSLCQGCGPKKTGEKKKKKKGPGRGERKRKPDRGVWGGGDERKTEGGRKL